MLNFILTFFNNVQLKNTKVDTFSKKCIPYEITEHTGHFGKNKISRIIFVDMIDHF